MQLEQQFLDIGTLKQEAIINQLLNSLSRELPAHDSVSALCLLLCWAKLSADKFLTGDLNLDGIINSPKPPHSEELQRLLGKISSKLEDQNPNIFMTESWIASRMHPQTFRNTLHLIADLALVDESTNFGTFFYALIKVLQANSNREMGESLIPLELADLLVRLSVGTETNSLYCTHSAAGIPAILAAKNNIAVHGEQRRADVLLLTANILCNSKIQIRVSDPLHSPSWVIGGELIEFDAAISCPPFGVRYDLNVETDQFVRFPEKPLTSEVLEIRHCLAQSKSRVAALVPMALLTRTAGGERDFRRSIIDSGLLQAVISLPSGVLLNTNIPTAIIILDKTKNAEPILFVDLTGLDRFIVSSKRGSRAWLKNVDQLADEVLGSTESVYAHLVDRSGEAIAANEYSLDPGRYVLSEDEQRFTEYMAKQKTVPLKSLCDIIRCQLVEDPKRKAARQFREVTVSDIEQSGLLRTPHKIVSASDVTEKFGAKQRLFPGDVLLSVKGSVGQVAYVTQEVGPDWIASQNFVILRVKNGPISPEVLFRYLRSEIGKRVLRMSAGGSTIPLLSTKAVEQLEVIVPSRQEQGAVEAMHEKALRIHAEIGQLLQEVSELEGSKWNLSQIKGGGHE